MDRWKWRRGNRTAEPVARVDPRRTVAATYPVDDAGGAAPDGAPDDTGGAWSPGDTIAGLYEVRDVLGQGMMGVVHRVRHLAWNTDLAVKTPLADLLVSRPDKERFIREAETWVSLGLHPHVCNCYYVRTLGGVPRVFTEYLDGGSLRDWIDDRRLYRGSSRKVLARVLDIAIQTAWGLEHSHSNGVVHQDVKPANVILDAEGTARVTDFGLARTQRGQGGGAGSRPGAPEPGAPRDPTLLVTVGGMTPAYASPEQVAGEVLDRRTDVWSFAVTVLEMFLGEITWFAGPSAAAALADHRRQGRAGGRLPVMPDPMAELLAHCLREDPAERPRDMAEITARLLPVYAAEVGRPYPRPAPRTVQLRADELNNRGLSLLDLGRFEEAEAAFAEALATDPRHLEATYDSGLLRWRAGHLTDDALVHGIEGVPTSTEAASRVKRQLLAEVHLERGSLDEALPLLEEAARAEPENTEIRTALLHAHAEDLATGRPLHTFGHSGSVVADLSADGRLAVSGDKDGTIRLWDADAGRALAMFRAHETDVYSICLSDDGLLILSAGMDVVNWDWCYTVRLWATETGECLWEHVNDKSVHSVRLSAGNDLLLFGSGDATVRVWDSEGRWGALGQHLGGTIMGEHAVWPSPDGRTVISGGMSADVLRLWDVETGACLRKFEGHDRSVQTVCMSADGTLAVSGSTDNTIRLWDVATGRCLRVLRGHTGSVNAVRISADARTVVSGAVDNTVRLWDVATGRCLRTFDGHTDSVGAVGLSADGRRAVSAGTDGTVRLWQLDGDNRYVCPLRPSRPRSHAELAQLDLRVEALLDEAERYLAKGRWVAARERLEKVRAFPRHERYPRALAAWHTLALSSVRVGARAVWQSGSLNGHTDRVHTVSVSADGRLVLSGSWDDTVRLWEAPTGRCLRVFEGRNGLGASCLSGDGRLALIRTDDGVVQLRETESGRVLHRLETPPDVVGPVGMGAGDRLALIGGPGGDNSTTTVWDLGTGRVLRTLEGRMSGGPGRLSLDGRLALTLGRRNTVRVWDLESGRELRALESPSLVGAVAVSADSRFVLVGSADHALRLWELSSGRCVRSFDGHAGEVYSACLSADGRFALSGSWDSTVRLWDVATGRCLHTLKGHTGEVASSILSADGRFAVSGGDDRVVRLWEIDWDLDTRQPADWDEGARPHLEAFLTLHTPADGDGILSRHGTPTWSEDDFDDLHRSLKHAGYGWLRPSGIRTELTRTARDWWDPPPL
ncbi:protein kinase domain-containing protein [Streptomyces chartreusis]|uniref:protein kinase domain-containing protein n=1 Tax=Streptomyces chartreusis TaxID=1969 RepID=UPI0037F73458|nr:protein kinase [Streptomyces chartreusis]